MASKLCRAPRGPLRTVFSILLFGVLLALGSDVRAESAKSREPLLNCPPPPPMALIAPSIVGAGSPNRIAFIAFFEGAVYSWTITNGTITAGQGSDQITFTAGVAGTQLTLMVSIDLNGCPYGGGLALVTVAPPGEAVLFYPVTPCRLVDTRNTAGPLGGPAIEASGGPDRSFALAGTCGVPLSATSLAVNLTVTNAQAAGDLSIYRGDGALSGTSSLTFGTGRARANDATLQLALDGSGTVKIHNTAGGTLDLIVDVSGYFE
jgi:hypothetical protein